MKQYAAFALLGFFSFNPGLMSAQEPSHNSSWHLKPALILAPEADYRLMHSDFEEEPRLSLGFEVMTALVLSKNDWKIAPFYRYPANDVGAMALHKTDLGQLAVYGSIYTSLKDEESYGAMGLKYPFEWDSFGMALFLETKSTVNELRPVIGGGLMLIFSPPRKLKRSSKQHADIVRRRRSPRGSRAFSFYNAFTGSGYGG